MPQPLVLVEKPGSKMRPRRSRGMPGPVVRDAKAGAALGPRLAPRRIVPPRPASASIAFFDEHLERPLEQHRVAAHVDGSSVRIDVDVDRVGERRHARAEVAGDRGRRARATSTGRGAARADALEPMGDAVEPLEIGAHVRHAPCTRAVVRRAILEELDPAGEAGERRAQLVRGLARHARPHPLALGVAARAHDVDAGEQEDERACSACSAGMMRSHFTSGVLPKWILPTRESSTGRVLPIQLARRSARSCVCSSCGAVDRQVRVVRSADRARP